MDIDLSESSILSIGDMITYAFGDADNNVVDHKLIQAILYLLARQLKLLERRVVVEIRGGMPLATGAGLTVSEVKLHAIEPSMIRRLSRGSSRFDLPEKSRTGAGSDTGLRVKGKGAQGKGAPSEKVAGKSGGLEQQETRKTSRSDPDTRSLEEVGQPQKKEPRGKRVSLSDEDRLASEKSFMDRKKSDLSTSKDPADIGKQPSERSIPADTSENIPPTKSIDEIALDRASIDQSVSSDKISAGKPSSDRSSEEGSAPTKATGSSTPSKKASSKDKSKKKEYMQSLETLEEQLERELRVIHQRADSREEQDESPTPMASLHSMGAQHGKLLIVEPKAPGAQTGKVGATPKLSIITQEQFAKLAAAVRQLQNKFAPIPSPEFADNAKLMDDLRKGASLTDGMAALQLSARLEAAEKALKQMGSLVTDLASETPGVNLKEFQEILALQGKDTGTEVIFGAPGTRSQSPGGKLKKGVSIPQGSEKGARGAVSRMAPDNLAQDQISVSGGDAYGKSTYGDEGAGYTSKSTTGDKGTRGGAVSKVAHKSSSQDSFDGDTQYEDEYVETMERKDKVTYEELDEALQNLLNDIMKQLQGITTRSTINAEKALKMASKLEGKVDSSLNLGDKMYDLENDVSLYAEQINRLDTGISSQMTDYQEQLTHMQHELEMGLETMAEVLGNPTGDPVAVAELNSRFTFLQEDIDATMLRQKELKDSQKIMALDLEALKAQIELLRDNKSDREDVADALHDKIGLGALNGLVTQQQFDAVRGDFEKRIGAAYDEFNGQEVIWQKAIDDLIRELNEKCDIVQVSSLKDEINRHIQVLRDRINAMKEILGEPRDIALSKKIHHDAACLSCSTPAYMDLVETGAVPVLPAARPQTIGESRPPAIGDEAPSLVPTKGEGFKPCYPGYPIPHPRDPRAHICQRYCGGSHTVLASALNRAPPGMVLTPVLRHTTTEVGTDGKTYIVDKPEMVPCLPCNVSKSLITHEPLTKEIQEAESPVLDSSSFRPSSFAIPVTVQDEVISVAPTPQLGD